VRADCTYSESTYSDDYNSSVLGGKMCKQLRATHWGRSEWVLRCETVLNNNIINCENHGLWQL